MLIYSVHVEEWTATVLCQHPTPDVVMCLYAPPQGGVKWTLPSGEELCIEIVPGSDYRLGATIAVQKEQDGYKLTMPPHARICKAPVS